METPKHLKEIDEILERTYSIEKEKAVAEPSFFEVDLDGNFVMVPNILVEITGFSREELDLLSLQNVSFVEDRPNVINSLKKVGEGAPLVVSEVELFSEKKGSHPVELILLPKFRGSDIAGIWGTIKDISFRRNLENRLKATQEVQEASQRFLTDFIALLSREIRQPLTTILLTLEMFDSGFFGDISDQQGKKIEELLNLVDRLKGILNEALETSKNIGEEIKLDRRMVFLERLIKEALTSKKDDIDEKQLVLNVNFPKKKIKAPVDRKAIFQVISSLLDYSVNSSPEKGHLLLELEDRGDEAQFTISDSGQGMPEEELTRLFDKINLSSDKEERSFSEGLNMYMSKRIIEGHGGNIWCESFPGLGSSYFFTVPLERNDKRGSDD